MREIVEYMLLSGKFSSHLNQEVNTAIEQGFQPYKKPFRNGGCCYQAVVKYAPKPTSSSSS